MTDAVLRAIWLGTALTPYAVLAAFDGWLHEKARRVPRLEQALHALAAAGVLAFLICVFAARDGLATIALAVFALAAVFDEFGFHRDLDMRERRVHFAAYVAFALFVVVWRAQTP